MLDYECESAQKKSKESLFGELTIYRKRFAVDFSIFVTFDDFEYFRWSQRCWLGIFLHAFSTQRIQIFFFSIIVLIRFSQDNQTKFKCVCAIEKYSRIATQLERAYSHLHRKNCFLSVSNSTHTCWYEPATNEQKQRERPKFQMVSAAYVPLATQCLPICKHSHIYIYIAAYVKPCMYVIRSTFTFIYKHGI